MLKTVWLTDNKKNSQGVAMLLGGFDGLHVGHRSLLARAKESGLPVGMMTIAGCKDKGVFTFAERELIFKESGADFVFELPFAEIKSLSAEEFLSLLINEFHPKLFVCGEDFVVTSIKNGKIILNPSKNGNVSIFSAVEIAKGVTVKGLLYELENAEINSNFPIGVSNEFIGKKAEISVEEGMLNIFFDGGIDDVNEQF